MVLGKYILEYLTKIKFKKKLNFNIYAIDNFITSDQSSKDYFEKRSEDDITPQANLKTTLELDSLDFVDLVVAVESNFGVKLVGDDFTNVVVLQDFYDLIERKVN